jgi:hypothetical protein
MIEEYKNIKDFENYEVSNTGIVRNKRRKKELSQQFEKNGYLRVSLGRGNLFYVHRLVGMAFCEGYEEGLHINHIDKDRSNNNAKNLEWVTQQCNNEYSFSKNYRFIDPHGEVREVFNLDKFCRKHSLNSGHMNSVHSGGRHHHKGWVKG